jgi:hypothetical protein
VTPALAPLSLSLLSSPLHSLLLPLLQLELFAKGKERTTLGAPFVCLGQLLLRILGASGRFQQAQYIPHLSTPRLFSLFSLIGSFLYKGTAVPGL